MSNKQPPGLIHSPKQLIEFFSPGAAGQNGRWVEINNGTHGAAAFVVWRMEDDEVSPKQEAFVLKVSAVNELFDALRLVAGEVTDCVRPTSADSHLPSDIVAAVHAAIAKATGANHA